MNILYFILLIILLYSIFLYILKIKIQTLEKKIIFLFWKRNDLIPSIYDITKSDFIKHNTIFEEILELRKNSIYEKKLWKNMIKIINTQKLIHNELNFIFKISEKHRKLQKNYKFLYLSDIIIEQSEKIWLYLSMYKNIAKKFNKLIFYKNLTIIWLLFPINKIQNI